MIKYEQDRISYKKHITDIKTRKKDNALKIKHEN